MSDHDRILDAILPHVPFDGWSEAALAATAADLGLDRADLTAHFPRGPVDAALAYHRRGDAALAGRLAGEDLSSLRYRDRIAAGVRFRLDGEDRELVRRGVTLFALPQHTAEGSKAIWETADAIWTALGDTSRDMNWYSKRATLSAVISATLLYWLGDESIGYAATWEFLDRRIDDVMRVESFKAKLRETKLHEAFMKGPGRILDHIRAPGEGRPGYPGHWGPDGG